MYTLTRKLSVVCLTVVLSFLVYGCGGSSKQALITDVSTEMVTAGLTPDAGTYNIQPGGTATAGDVTFACPAEGSSCEVTVADDGTVTSAGGMATAMDSAAAEARAERIAEIVRLNEALTAAGTAQMEAIAEALAAAQITADTAQMEAIAEALAAAQITADTAQMEAIAEALAAAQITADTAQMEAIAEALAAAQITADTAQMEAVAEALAAAQITADTAQMEAIAEALAAAQITADTAQMEAIAEALAAAQITADTAQMEAVAEALAAAQITADTAQMEALAAQMMLLTTVNSIDVATAMGYGTVTPGVFTIEPGGTNTELGDDVTFACPEEGSPCVVIITVNEDGVASYTSLGGVATGGNSMTVMRTRAAVALHSPGNTGLNTGTAPMTTVERETAISGGDTTITLTHDGDLPAAAAVEYTSEAVDTDHEIDGWPGQTMSRSDADDLPTPQVATVYTNIDPATQQLLKLGDADTAVTTPDGENVFVLDPGQDVDTINMAMSDMDRMFRAAYNGVPGTFTCVADATCADIATSTITGGQKIITNSFNAAGWTFESDDFVETEATQDADYMYLGYWLQSPENPGVDDPMYMFVAFSGGANEDEFDLPAALRDNTDEALTATYEGGAAGRYVTRKLRIKDQGVDDASPGYHGRFTATATLTAHFGDHDDFDADAEAGTENTHNTIGGTITDFMDGATDLGFEVTLGRLGIENDGEIIGVADTATAKFSETPTSTTASGMGQWSGQFYGPAADVSEEVMEDPKTHLPSGVAGQFNASSTYTNVVGAFAAEKQ